MTSENLQQAFGYLFPDELATLKQLAQSLPDNPVVVNIGAGSGTSGLAFLESRPDLRLHTIDLQFDDSPFGCITAELREVQRAGYLARYFYEVGDSKAIGARWPFKVDMVFVDGDHSYQGAKGDILTWLANIKPGGIMAVHDYNKVAVYKRGNLPDKVPHPMPWHGVDRAVRKFLLPGYEIVAHVDTLIVVRVK